MFATASAWWSAVTVVFPTLIRSIDPGFAPNLGRVLVVGTDPSFEHAGSRSIHPLNAERVGPTHVRTVEEAAGEIRVELRSKRGAILLHGTQNKPAGNYDTGLIFGDYYFLEALLRYTAR